MIVCHGSTEEVKSPDTAHSLRYLDFGSGFYVTSVKKQAEQWALRKMDILHEKRAIVSVFRFEVRSSALSVKTFPEDLGEWLDFVCACRSGKDVYKSYDIITGKVANDKVYRVVNMYQRGIWDKKRAIEEMRAYETYDQTALISQRAIDECLTFENSYEVTP